MSIWRKLIFFLPIVFLALLAGMGLTYSAAKKGQSFPAGELSPIPDGVPAPLANGRFYLGEITVPSGDPELHYIKVELEIRFLGDLEKTLETRKFELRERVSQVLARMTIQRAKEDFPDNFMQESIKNELNMLLKSTASHSRIDKVTIASFLIN